MILFDGTGTDPIDRVPAAGGTPVPIVKADAARKEATVGWPEFLPGGHRFLYMAAGQKIEDNMYRIGSLDSPETKTLGSGSDSRHVRAARDTCSSSATDADGAAFRRRSAEDDR